MIFVQIFYGASVVFLLFLCYLVSFTGSRPKIPFHIRWSEDIAKVHSKRIEEKERVIAHLTQEASEIEAKILQSDNVEEILEWAKQRQDLLDGIQQVEKDINGIFLD